MVNGGIGYILSLLSQQKGYKMWLELDLKKDTYYAATETESSTFYRKGSLMPLEKRDEITEEEYYETFDKKDLKVELEELKESYQAVTRRYEKVFNKKLKLEKRIPKLEKTLKFLLK